MRMVSKVNNKFVQLTPDAFEAESVVIDLLKSL